jgi:hypothetical protein
MKKNLKRFQNIKQKSGHCLSDFYISHSCVGDDSLTAADIQRLQPFTQVVEPQVIQLNGVQAVLFWSAVPEVGKTREVWLAKSGKLFSVTTHADHDAWLAHIMTTWRFE